MVKNYLIIGASAAGIGCALRLRMLDATAGITVLNAESGLPYNKCHMADVLLGEKSLDEITFCSAELLARKNIELICNAQVVAIDPVQKRVMCGNLSRAVQSFTYDALCIATGKSPRMLPLFAGKKFNNVFNFYYKSDLEQIISYIDQHKPRTAVVIGSGLTGLEAADGLRARGLAVTIVEAGEQLLPTLVNERAAQLIGAHSGVHVYAKTQIHTYSVHMNGQAVLKLLDDIPGDEPGIIVCAIGATPNTQFLPASITLQDGYCVVNEYMQTSAPDIFAAGDCCMVYDQLTKRVQPNALWPDAMQQGMHAAYGMVGMPKKYPGSVSVASSSFFGYKVAVSGPVVPESHHRLEEYPALSSWHPNCPPASANLTHDEACWYHRLIYDQEKLVGFMLIGNTSKFSDYRRQLLNR